MILAGDEAQAQFATVGIRPHLSGPHGSFASLRAVPLSCQTMRRRARPSLQSSRRIVAEMLGRSGLGPVVRPTTWLEPPVPSASLIPAVRAAQPLHYGLSYGLAGEAMR